MRWVTLLFAVVLLGACATGYQASSFSGGYSETRISERSYEVSFSGNGFTAARRAHNGALRRAAELTAYHGFYGFWIESDGTDIARTATTDPVRCTTIGSSTTCNGGDTRYVEKPTSTIVITMVSYQEALSARRLVYDARMVLARPPD